MLILRNSPLGGRPTLKHRYPLTKDRAGNFGVRLGYLADGDPVILRMSDAEEIANQLGYTTKGFWQRIGDML